MSYENTPLPTARGLVSVRVKATPGKIKVIRSSPTPKPSGADGAAEKDAYEDARLSQIILILARWLKHADKQGIIRNVLLTEKWRNVRHGGKWHREAIFDDLHKELGSLRPLDERWDHNMLIGDLFASEVSWLRDDLIEKQKEWRLAKPAPPSPPIWDGDWFLGVPSPLDRPNEFATEPERRRAGFTVRAREALQSAGAVAEMEWGLNGIMITMTLPGTSRDAYELLADYSGEIMSRLRDRTSLHCKRKLNRPSNLGWFYVWEKQKRGALHVHAYLGADPAEFNIDELLSIGNLITDWWFQTLRKIGNENGVNMFYNAERGIDWSDSPDKWQSDVQPIKHSVARYFSKYVSKDAATKKGATFEGEKDGHPTPRRWWGKNQVMTQMIKKWSFEFVTETSNPLDIPLNEIIHESLQVHGRECHTDCHTEDYTSCHTGCHTGIDKAKTDFWEVVRKVKIDTPNGEVEFNKTFCNGVTSTYLYSPENYKEVFHQCREMKSVILAIAETTQDRMIPWDERQPPIIKEVEKPISKWDKDLIRGIDPTNGNIWDIERYTQYEIWKNMQDPWYFEETMRMEREAAEYRSQLDLIYLNQLQDMTRQNEYEKLFGNSNPDREFDIWQEVAALTAIWEMEAAYFGDNPESPKG